MRNRFENGDVYLLASGGEGKGCWLVYACPRIFSSFLTIKEFTLSNKFLPVHVGGWG